MRNNCIIIWYSDQKKQYFLNTGEEINSNSTGFKVDFDNILYTMEDSKLKLATKIKNRLNEARRDVTSDSY